MFFSSIEKPKLHPWPDTNLAIFNVYRYYNGQIFELL